ncbi:MAG TPA: nuclear transport factor 2 family protein [Thermoleophilaceae bacterium]|jgi:ketosteroid isomerase-like protein|nr:nuclear transport factor 2 family protein [Thermoleophilaceae bacterium]
MASANSTLALAAIDAWAQRDKEALLACFSPDFEFILSGQIPDQPLEIHGHAEYSRFFDTWLASWETFSFAAVRIADVDEACVLLKTTQFGIARDGMKVDRVVWFVADVADGLIARYRAFIDEQAALAAAGVDAWPPDSELSGADEPPAIQGLRSGGGSSSSRLSR